MWKRLRVWWKDPRTGGVTVALWLAVVVLVVVYLTLLLGNAVAAAVSR